MRVQPDPARFTVLANGAAEPPMLSRLEWKVVALALDEALRGGGGEPGAFGRFARRMARTLFGIESARPLADPRLETLRRFVCAARRGHRDAMALAKRLMDHGFSAGQVRAVEMLAAR